MNNNSQSYPIFYYLAMTLKQQSYMFDTGIINFSVCNVHKAEDSSSEMLTQGLLGMEVSILERRKWIRIKLKEDGYEGWVHPRAVVIMNNDESWLHNPKIIITSHFGFSYISPDMHSQCVSDVVSGNRLLLLDEDKDYFHIAYPDGRRAYISTSIAQKEEEWKKDLDFNASNLIKTALTFMGIPYLWGGMSAKGMDCSGFVKLCFLLNGKSIPRDTCQQVLLGKSITINPDFSNLLPGDLLFFGTHIPQRPNEGIEHIGIHIENGRYIHSQGNIHISSLNVNDQDYENDNRKHLLQVKRYSF